MRSRKLLPASGEDGAASWMIFRTWYTYRIATTPAARPTSRPARRHPGTNAATATRRPSTSTTIPRLSPGPGTFTLLSSTNLAGIVYAVRAGARKPATLSLAPQFSQLETATNAPPTTIRTRPTAKPRAGFAAASVVADMGNPLVLRLRAPG